VSFVAWHRPLRDRPRRYLLVSVGTIFRTDIADLGFSLFYFSCKSYQELAQARITKVVGFFTTNPTKLGLQSSDFSTIFYTIYKNQQRHFYYLRSAFTTRPLTSFPDSRTGPWFTKISLERFGSPQLGPWGLTAGGLAGFRRGGGRGWWGEGGGGLMAHLGLDSVGRTGAGRLRRAASAAPVGTGRRTASAGAR
jgi:hypothetical protein